MATDPRDYFNSRLVQELDRNAQLGVSSKFDDLQKASADKAQLLRDMARQNKRSDDLFYASQRGRTLLGTANDIGITALKGAVGLPQAFVGLADIPTGGRVGKALEGVGYRPAETQKILSELYSEQQRAASQEVEEAEGFVGTLGAAIENPSTIATAIGESIPQMLGGAAVARGLLNVGSRAVGAGAGGVGPTLPGVMSRTLGASTAPVVAGAVGEGLIGAGAAASQIRGETDDGLLTPKQSLAAVGAGVGTGILGFAGGRLAQRLGLPDIDTMLASGNRITPAGFLKAVVGAGITEGVFEEMPQSAQEQMWQNFALDKPLLEGVPEAAAMGLLTGAAMGGMAGAASGTQSAASNAVARSQENLSKSEALQAAIASGDVSAYVDPQNPAYAPDRAVAALFGNSQLPDATPEIKQANLAKASQVVTDLEARREELQAQIDSTSPDKLQANLDRNRTTWPADLVATVESEIAALRATPADAKAIASLERQAADLDQKITKSRDALSVFAQDSQPKDVDVAVEAEQANSADPAISRTAADRVINLSMTIPERLEASVATQLAENTGNALTAPQRAYLRAFSAARAAENLLKDMGRVSKEVFFGGNGNLGIKDYRANVGTALVAGNRALADRQLKLLTNFIEDHTAKSTVGAQGLQQFQTTGQAVQMRSDGQRGWYIHTGKPLSASALRKEGGLFINEKSRNLVAEFKTESDALTKAATELQAAYGLKFNQPANTGVRDVQNVSQSPQGIQGTPQELRSEATQEAGTDSTVAATGRGAAASVQADAATGVDAVVDPVQEAPASSVNTAPTQTDQGQLQSTEEGSTTAADLTSEVATDVEESAAATTAVVESGTLVALQDKSPEGRPFNLRNLLADFFTQTASREGDVTQRPLVAVKDFLSQGSQSVLQYLQSPTLSVKQQEVLQLFRTKAAEWQSQIQESLARRTKEYWFEDMTQFLIQDREGKLDLEENVKTAMSYAAFSWVAENASRSAFNTDEEINAILDRVETHLVSPEERKALASVGTRQNLVINALGQRAVQALGLTANKDAPKNLMPDLEAALGARIWKLLMDNGILGRTTVSGAQMAQMTGNTDTNVDAEFQFVKLARDANGNLNEQTEQIAQASAGSQNVLDKLFSVESGLKEPSLEPIEFTQKKTRNTNQNVPKTLEEVVAEKQAEANYVRQDMWQLVTQLSDDIALAMAGVSNVSNVLTHVANRLGLQAKNDGLKREYERFMNFVRGMDDVEAPMYFEHSVWKQQRVGIATNVINPQSSKIHRFMLFRKTWDTKVNLDNEAEMNNFRLRVLEGLGVKTERQSNATSLAAYDSYVNAPEIQAAVAVLQKTLYEGGITADEQRTLLAGVQKGKQNFHSLDALMALAHEAQARQSGNESFNVQMMGEIDGVTNGPMISHLLMGAAATAKDLFGLLNRGGFFQTTDSQQQYSLWKEATQGLDLYENTARNMTRSVQRLLSTNPKMGAALNAVYSFTGMLEDPSGSVTSEGRKIIKTPLTAMVFGSSVSSAVDSMADSFVGSIYATIEQVAAGKESLKTVTDNINTLLLLGRGSMMPRMSLDKLMNYEFSANEIKALKRSFKDTLGKAVDETIKADFGPFIERRDALNKAAQLSFEIYNATYQGLRDTFIEELIAKNELAVNPTTREPIQDLTMAQEAELQKRLRAMAPIMHTLMSKDSGSLASGLYASKSGRKLSTRDTHKGNIKFGKPVKGSKVWSPKKKGYVEQSSVNVTGFENVESAPGVAMMVLSAHSTDSAISHSAAKGNEVLNIHDAHGAGLANFAQTAQNLNQATWNAMLNYSPAAEMASMLSRTVMGLAQLVQEGNVSPEVMKNLTKALQAFAQKNEMDVRAVLPTVMLDASFMALKADQIRLGALGQMGSVDQYAMQGGNYVVTDADRAAANEKLAGLKIGLTDAERDAMSALNVALGNPGSPKTASASAATSESGATTPRNFAEIPGYQPGQKTMRYAGIGSRETPPAVLAQMTTIAKRLADKGYTLLSGGAKGADSAFESGAGLLKQIFYARDATDTTRAIAREIHPNPAALGDAALNLMARNTNQVFGVNLNSPVDFVLVWTPDGAQTSEERSRTTGGTGQAIDMADRKGVPVINLAREGWEQELEKLLASKQAATVTSAFGPVGTSAIQSEGDLVAFFEANPNATAQQVIGLLGQSGRLNAINTKLLKLVSRVVNPNLRIRFVTPKTAESEVLEKPTTNARGWFVIKDNQAEIYVLSPDFVNSGLTAETLLHELVHAAVARVIDKPSKEAAELVEELDALRIKAQEFASQNGLTQYAAALANVQEFVAWGMSNLGFQRDVLTKISMESKTGSNRLVSGMKKFIDALTRLLFKKPDANINNGLAVLVGNVSGLFNQAAQSKTDSSTRLNLAQETVAPIDRYTTLDINQALDNGTLEPAFKEQLTNLLTGIVEKLHGPFGAFAASMRKTEAKNPLAVWLKAMETGNAPFASSIVASGYAATAQEDFVMQQVEATVKAALNNNEAQTKLAYKQLSDLYTEMRAKLKPSDFASQEDYDFVFKLESDNGDRSDYLARFAALGLASQKFNALLKVATATNPRRVGEAQSFADRIQGIFESILAFFNEKITKTYAGQDADAKLEALVGQLVDIEAKKRHLLKMRATETNYLAPVEDGVRKITETLRTKAGELAGSDLVRNSGSTLVKAAGTLTRTVANDQVELFLAGIQKLRDKEFKERPGVAASLLTELTGLPAKFQALLRATKRNEGLRKSIITQTGAVTLRMFANQGKNLGKQAKASISSVFLRTGAHNLLDHYNLAQIENLIDNPTAVNAAIESFSNQLTSKVKDRYIEQANALGYYKATGKSANPVLMLNAHLISRMAGTQFKRLITEADAKQAEPIIKALVSLYALKYANKQDLAQAKELLRTENSRTDGNGIDFVLKLHKQLESESLQRLFKGNPALMVHGYTPEILNPHTAIKIADDQEGKDLINQGYSVGGKVIQDQADPNTLNKRIYVLRDGGLAPYLSGVFSLSGLQSKGSKKHSGYVNVTNQAGLENAAMQAEITNRKLKMLQTKTDPGRDLSTQTGNHLVPIYNEMGDIVNWRYMMAESTKNDLLERDNRFENVLGALAGSVFDKETSQEQNSQAINALLEDYDANKASDADSYIEVGERSSDPEMRAIWNLLPDNTKREVRKVWGRDGMRVRKNSLDLMFGYRKLSLAAMFQKDPDARNKLEQLFVGVLENVMSTYAGMKYNLSPEDAKNYAKRAATALTRGERAWQEVVREIKDIIVVKTGFVMMGNIWSNLSLLAMDGVSLKEIVQHHLVALKGATAYQRDSQRLAELETVLEVGYSQGNEKAIRDEIVRLKDSIARNPVRELIEAGLMPTIVEDISTEEDIYSYKSGFVRDTERFTSKLNPKIRDAAKLVYMTHDTKLYQGLSRITQLSDFVARYTLYQHLTNRKTDPLSKTDAIQEASDAFVNYDIPMHRGLQYADDMGIMMFTKYYLRIQRVLLKMARDNPARVLGTLLLNNYMDLGSIVLDSAFTTRIGNNPFGLGALNFPGTLDELATVQAGMALVK